MISYQSSPLTRELYPAGLPKDLSEVRLWPLIDPKDPRRSTEHFAPIPQFPAKFKVGDFNRELADTLVRNYWTKYEERRAEQERVMRYLKDRMAEEERQRQKEKLEKGKAKARASVPDDYDVENFLVSNLSAL